MDPFELMGFVSKKGMNIRHAQFVPEYDGMNILYGTDWQNGRLAGKRNASITLIAEKS